MSLTTSILVKGLTRLVKGLSKLNDNGIIENIECTVRNKYNYVILEGLNYKNLPFGKGGQEYAQV